MGVFRHGHPDAALELRVLRVIAVGGTGRLTPLCLHRDAVNRVRNFPGVPVRRECDAKAVGLQSTDLLFAPAGRYPPDVVSSRQTLGERLVRFPGSHGVFVPPPTDLPRSGDAIPFHMRDNLDSAALAPDDSGS